MDMCPVLVSVSHVKDLSSENQTNCRKYITEDFIVKQFTTLIFNVVVFW